MLVTQCAYMKTKPLTNNQSLTSKLIKERHYYIDNNTNYPYIHSPDVILCLFRCITLTGIHIFIVHSDERESQIHKAAKNIILTMYLSHSPAYYLIILNICKNNITICQVWLKSQEKCELNELHINRRVTYNASNIMCKMSIKSMA